MEKTRAEHIEDIETSMSKQVDELESLGEIKVCLLKFANELESIADPVLPSGVDIHLYEVEKCGRGWKVLNYNWSNVGIIPVYSENSLGLINHLDTLPKIISNYKNTPNTVCHVMNGNLEAPSKIYQLIIECGSQKKVEAVRNILKRSPGLNYEVLLSYEWVTDVPKDILKVIQDF